MAIQNRRGLRADFDPSKMRPGEWAVSIDADNSNHIIWMCFAPGVVERIGTLEAFDRDIQELIKAQLDSIDASVAEAAGSATDAATSETNAAASAKAASTSASAAASSASTATTKASAASTSATNSAASATTASTKASAASASASNAATSASTATTKANAAATSETSAANSASTASTKASAAATSATNAASSATSAASSAGTASTKASAAASSATSAKNSATESESFAIGGTGTRENEDIDNAKYYADQAKRISEGLKGSLLPMGTIAFAALPDTSTSGYMYNISDQFTTTARFKEGAGHVVPAGTNVYYTADGYWDCMAGSPVSGVKGNSETSYRSGNVNITPANIGLGNVPNVSTNDQTPIYTAATALAALTSGEKLSVAFGKIAKAISSFIAHATLAATTSVLGHVKLTNSVSSTSTTTAAVPANVKAAYDKAAAAMPTANIKNSMAVTTAGTYAADAVQLNPAVPGTFAEQVNNNLSTHKSSGDHDGRYYTETEMDTKLSTLAAQVKVVTYVTDNISIAASNIFTHYVTASLAGYSLAGIAGYSVANASSGGTSSSACYVFGAFRNSSTQVILNIKNTSSSTAKVKITTWCLFIKN